MTAREIRILHLITRLDRGGSATNDAAHSGRAAAPPSRESGLRREAAIHRSVLAVTLSHALRNAQLFDCKEQFNHR